jgi:hypothetical protein
MIVKLCRLARTLILWPIDAAASALYDYGLKTIEGLLDTTEAFDNLAQAATNTMRSYTTDDYHQAATVINRTELVRTNPWLDYDEELGAPPAMQRTYADGSTSSIDHTGITYRSMDGYSVHLGE